jgi:hypothetical protein
MGEGDSVEISNFASRLAPHTASEGPVKIGGVSGLWARPGGLAACGKRGWKGKKSVIAHWKTHGEPWGFLYPQKRPGA